MDLSSGTAKERDWGVLVDEKLDVTWRCALAAQKANRILGASPAAWPAGRGRGFCPSAPLWGDPPAVLRPARGSSAQERHGAVGAGPEEATKMLRGVEHLCCEDRLRELGLFSLEKRRLWEAFQYTNYIKDGERPFSKACSDRTRGNSFTLKEGRFRLDIRKKFWMVRVVKHWNRLPRAAVDAPSLGSVPGQAGWGFGQPGLVEEAIQGLLRYPFPSAGSKLVCGGVTTIGFCWNDSG
ncbi:hypothetical protein QYF61_010566 [Mycteria americana]|uniref:Uncharacterized protein n=1 Tax=Mycteria americana TaxID=33587 RepID=A0AAN7SG04_MYCAM|nr:hypothetical protein QYF61_010566 [Mycteria americana]